MNSVTEKKIAQGRSVVANALMRKGPSETVRIDTADFDIPDVADLAHALTVTHGGLPNIFDLASLRSDAQSLRNHLVTCSNSFQDWRRFLSALTSKAGPAPSLTDDAAHMVSLVQTKQGIQLLGESERKGCAIGAAFAMLNDWQIVLPESFKFAARLDIVEGIALPPRTSAIIEEMECLEPSAAELRAMSFGADQFYQLNDAFFRHLEARRKARKATKRL